MDFNWSSRLRRGGASLGVVLASLGFLLSPVPAMPWGCDGHQAVAMIAEKHMSAHALEMANRLLQSEPIDPYLSRYCPSQGLDSMADSSTWPDDLRYSRPESSPWHYIDIPRGAPRSDPAQFCPAATGCVTSALQDQIELLRSDAANPRLRADALRFVIHFVGDLHQPLHCATNNDMGGNCVPIDFFGSAPVEKNPRTESYTPNLHSIWDAYIIERMRGMQTVSQWAASLDQQFSPHVNEVEKSGINFDDWAWEGNGLANSVVYAKLPVPIPVEKAMPVRACADDNHVSTRMLKLHEQVAQSYVDAVAPTIDEQIAKAGVRLAMILNQIWP